MGCHDRDCLIANDYEIFGNSKGASVVVTLLQRTCASTDESLCVAYEAYWSGGQTTGVRVTVLISVMISFSLRISFLAS